MGAPIARRLQQNGYALTLYARRPKIFEGELADLIANGANCLNSQWTWLKRLMSSSSM